MQKTGTKKLALIIMIVILSLIVSACGNKEPEVDIDAQRTGFAQTANAQATLTAESQPTATQTPPATQTPTQEITATSEVTATSTEDEEAPNPTATTGSVSGVDTARWLSNDPADKSDFSPGETFTVTWKIENKGTTTWTTNYYIQFASGVQMAADEKVFLAYPVPPNTNVQISVSFTATEELGEKKSAWKLFNDKDNAFYDFYIIVDVVDQPEVEPTAEATTEEPGEATATSTPTVTPTVTATEDSNTTP